MSKLAALLKVEGRVEVISLGGEEALSPSRWANFNNCSHIEILKVWIRKWRGRNNKNGRSRA